MVLARLRCALAELVKGLQVQYNIITVHMPVHIQFAYCYDMKIYLPLSLSQIGKSCFDQAEGRLPAAVDGVGRLENASIRVEYQL